MGTLSYKRCDYTHKLNYANIFLHNSIDTSSPRTYNTHRPFWLEGNCRKLTMSELLTWESTYAIALELKRAHPGIDMSTVTLGDIQKWTFALPDFDDDPALVNDEILSAIYQDWYEEILHE